MTSGGFSFGLQQPTAKQKPFVFQLGSRAKKESTPKPSSSRCRERETPTSKNVTQPLNVFESSSTSQHDESIQSRSRITALGSQGFQEIVDIEYQRTAHIIPCKHRISRSKPHSTVSETKKKPSELHSSASISVDPEASKEQYGLAGLRAAGFLTDRENATVQALDDDEELRPRFMSQKAVRERLSEKRTAGNEPVPLLQQNRSLADIRAECREAEASQLFRREVETLPEFSCSSYDTMPVESFGMAMLRGMGYDPKKHHREPVVAQKRAYQRAGLGADHAFEARTIPPSQPPTPSDRRRRP